VCLVGISYHFTRLGLDADGADRANNGLRVVLNYSIPVL
jgi:hypothetical protein